MDDTILDYALFNINNITSVVISDSVTSIGGYAFAYCSNLTNVTIGSDVTLIEPRVFYSSSNLTSLTFTPIGWWISTENTANSGTSVPESILSNASLVAKYLKSTSNSYYWNRS